MPEGLEDLMEKPLAITNNAIAALTKKAAASFWGKFKRQLSTASEPILRKNMGERYLSNESLGGGLAIWLLATGAALYWPEFRSAGVVINGLTSFYWLGNLINNIVPTILVGGALIFFHVRFGTQNIKLMAAYREAGTPYHTQSHGVPRWEGSQAMMPLIIVVALLLFDLPAGILFVISCGMSAKIAGEQQAAIYSRYLDALDAKIEQEYLEEAILGKCPAEITQLHKPLPAAMSADLRKNIAAAAVGKPVAIVVKGNRIGGRPSIPEPPPGGAAVSQQPAQQTSTTARAGTPIQPDGAPSGQQMAVGDPPLAQPTKMPDPQPTNPGTQSARNPRADTPDIPIPQAIGANHGQTGVLVTPTAASDTVIQPTHIETPSDSSKAASASQKNPASVEEILFSCIWRENVVAEALERVRKEPALKELYVRSALAQGYEFRKYGLNPPPRSVTKIGMDDSKAREFAPEILDLFEHTLDPAHVVGFVEKQKLGFANLSTIEIVLVALRTGCRKDGLAWLKAMPSQT